MTWIDVDAEQVRTEASRLQEAENEIERLSEYAREADPDWWTWGVAGLVVAPFYFTGAELFHSVLGEASESIAGLRERLIECADDYDEVDGDIAQELEKIGQEIEEGTF